MSKLVSRLIINNEKSEFYLFRISKNYQKKEDSDNLLLKALINLGISQKYCFLYIDPFKDILAFTQDNK